MKKIFLFSLLKFALGSCGTEHINAKNGLVGFVSSPNFPNGYPGNQNCIFILTADPGFVVHLVFVEFDLEDKYSKSEQCLKDYVLLTVTDDAGRDHVGTRYCGNELPNPFRTMQKRVKIRFVSSYASKKKGFKIKYEFVPEAKVIQPPSLYGDPDPQWQKHCGGHNNEDEIDGEIISPGFPSTFPKNISCHWLIRVSANKRIYIRLIHLELSPTMGNFILIVFNLLKSRD